MDKKIIKGYYLHSIGFNVSAESLSSYGVQKKINAQLSAFNVFFRCEEKVCIQEKDSIKKRIVSRLPFTAISEKWVYDKKYDDVDFIYFRKNIIDASIVRFFKKIKKHNKNCKIIFEIPTYPYDKEEWKSLKDLPFKLKDRINRKKLHKYIDRITTYANDSKSIFNTPAINLVNGIDFNSIPLAVPCTKKDKTIDIFIVALFSRWHGFDRLIQGLANYYKKKGKANFILHFVGDGVVIPDYKALSKSLYLGEHIIFHGKKSGKELDDIANCCEMACDSLGAHRINLSTLSTLKSREYSARGLPIIAASKIDFLPDDYEYLLKTPSNDDPIDFNEVYDFYCKIYKGESKQNVFRKVREYASKFIDIKSTIFPVVEYLKSGKEM